ncbi:carbohydrate-binding module family 14 protein [Palleronia pelagia]|uniref:Chitin binding Peritrophin-A domain-containing protein n=1 Tax=Palleronia pelagia TaxID=387096 RepID=A0A1H8IJY1_9RHOB|nr:carbohydrate-binding module family 14 protein [Palleronia pelagia]SEN68579.1 Chitin binding Peritrophin-A domain-containing protein [Palleronia pelagia]
MIMTLKIALTTAVLAIAPGLAVAQCEWSKQVSMTCAAGTVYDSESQSCVPVSS